MNGGYGVEEISEMISPPASRYGIVRMWLLCRENGSCRRGDYEFCAETDGDMALPEFKAFFLDVRDVLDADIDIICRDSHDKNSECEESDRVLIYERGPVP